MTASEILRAALCPEPGDPENLCRMALLRSRGRGLDLWHLPAAGLEALLADLRWTLGRYRHAADAWSAFDRGVDRWKLTLSGATRPPTKAERRESRRRGRSGGRR